MCIFVHICKFKNFERKSYFKKNVIAIAIAQNVPLYGQTLISGIIICYYKSWSAQTKSKRKAAKLVPPSGSFKYLIFITKRKNANGTSREAGDKNFQFFYR